MFKSLHGLLVFLFVLCSISASGQVRSLKDLPPGEKYRNLEGGFEIALPRDPGVKVSPSTGTLLTWLVKEGVIVINYWDRGLDAISAPKGADRAAQIEQFVNEYKKGLSNDPTTSMGENKRSTIAGLPVTFFTTKIGDRLGVSSVYVEDHRSIIFLMIPLAEVPESEDTLSEALETFKLIPRTR